MNGLERLKQKQREEVMVYEVRKWANSREVCIARTVDDAIHEARMMLREGEFGVTIQKGRIHPDDLASLPACVHAGEAPF